MLELLLHSVELDAPRVMNVPNRTLGFATNSWLGKSTSSMLNDKFLAVFCYWHAS